MSRRARVVAVAALGAEHVCTSGEPPGAAGDRPARGVVGLGERVGEASSRARSPAPRRSASSAPSRQLGERLALVRPRSRKRRRDHGSGAGAGRRRDARARRRTACRRRRAWPRTARRRQRGRGRRAPVLVVQARDAARHRSAARRAPAASRRARRARAAARRRPVPSSRTQNSSPPSRQVSRPGYVLGGLDERAAPARQSARSPASWPWPVVDRP